MIDTNNELKASLFRVVRAELKRCFEPHEQCNSISIRAHSIQNKKVLDQLSQAGHVIMPQERIVEKGERILVDFMLVGRNEASTFTGLCAKHDKEIFSPIDDFDIDIGNKQQLFLLAYRSVLKKLHSLLVEAQKLEQLYQDQVKIGVATYDASNPVQKLVMTRFIRAYCTYNYKRIFDQVYLANTYNTVHHETFSFKHQAPTVAVSGLYWLEIEKPNATGVPRLILNIFPIQRMTHVVFSYLDEDAQYIREHLDGILKTSLRRRLWLISKTIIGACDNFVISPFFWKNLSKRRRDSIGGYYKETLLERTEYDGIIQDLCLFTPSYGEKKEEQIMKPNTIVNCNGFPCLDTRRGSYLIPDNDIDPAKVSILLISEAQPGDPADSYYAGENALFARTTLLAFQDAGVKVQSMQELLNLGVYLTTAIKCGKTGYGIVPATIVNCSHLLEKEISLFPSVKVYLLMGDVAIKAVNMIAKRIGDPRPIPAGSTYKIRGGEFTFRGARALPSYVQAGPAFFVEKSKRKMIGEDIRKALEIVQPQI